MSEQSEQTRIHRLQETKREERSRGKVVQPKGHFKDLFVKEPVKGKVSGNSQPSKKTASSNKRQ